MENNTEILDSASDNKPALTLSTKALNFLREITKWARFLSIMGFIGVAAMVVFGFFAGTIYGGLGQQIPNAGAMSAVMTIAYTVAGVIYFFPVYYLFKFANNMKMALNNNDTEVLDAALEYLKSHYKYIGILTIVLVGFYVLAAIFGGMVAMFM